MDANLKSDRISDRNDNITNVLRYDKIHIDRNNYDTNTSRNGINDVDNHSHNPNDVTMIMISITKVFTVTTTIEIIKENIHETTNTNKLTNPTTANIIQPEIFMSLSLSPH